MRTLVVVYLRMKVQFQKTPPLGNSKVQKSQYIDTLRFAVKALKNDNAQRTEFFFLKAVCTDIVYYTITLRNRTQADFETKGPAAGRDSILVPFFSFLVLQSRMFVDGYHLKRHTWFHLYD